MKKKILLLSTILICMFMSSCEDKNKSKDIYSNNKQNLERLLLKNFQVQDSIKKIFYDNPVKRDKIFKVILSRKDNFLRITVYQMFNLHEIKQVPDQIIFSQQSAFFCYNGNELLEGRKLKLDSINKLLKLNKLSLENNSGIDITDPRYLQFDFFNWNKIIFNNPIYPDFNEPREEIKFK